jgi:hypothetical protein
MIGDAPVRLGVPKSRRLRIVECSAHESLGHAAVFVFRTHRESTHVQGVVERSTARIEGKRDALGDGVPVVFDDVKANVRFLQGVEHLFGPRGVFDEEREARTALLRVIENVVELKCDL